MTFARVRQAIGSGRDCRNNHSWAAAKRFYVGRGLRLARPAEFSQEARIWDFFLPQFPDFQKHVGTEFIF